MLLSEHKAVVVGAGIGGLVTAVELARRGIEVHVFERGEVAGGKMRRIQIGERTLDGGPTVLTMRSILEEIFDDAGASLEGRLELDPVDCIARHTWENDGVFDLFVDKQRSADSVRDFFGPREAKNYLRFCDYARAIFEEVEQPFLRAQRPRMVDLMAAQGLRALTAASRIDPFRSMMKALRDHFKDPRLLQLFGRYATYSGSSPYLAPATLSLIAHVEREGVWLVRGGMHRLAQELQKLSMDLGVRFHFSTSVSEITVDRERVTGVKLERGDSVTADIVVANAEARALTEGLLGASPKVRGAIDDRTEPSQSAVTWNTVASTSGFPLAHHSVFFSNDYAREFKDIGGGRLPAEPTVYICAQDRDDMGMRPVSGPERLLVLVNAPASRLTSPSTYAQRVQTEELERCQSQTFEHLSRCGLSVDLRTDNTVRTSPSDFARAFPGSRGALYGGASHGWRAFFNRPSARTRVPGLYLAGASAHPGAGVPMVALSGRLAAQSATEDLALTSKSRPMVMPGGTLTPSRTMANTA